MRRSSLAHREVKAVDPFQCRGWEFSETGGPGIAPQRRPRVNRLAPPSPVANVTAAFADIQPGFLAKLTLRSAPYPARLRRDQRVLPSSRPVRSQKRSNEWCTAARRFRKNERRGRASAHFPPRRPRSAQRKRPPESRPFWGRERPGGSSHEIGAWFDIRSPASQDSDYQTRACHGSRNESDGWNWVRAWITM